MADEEGRKSRRRWYAVHVKSNQERTTTRFLEGRAVEVFLPTYRTVSSRRDRRVELVRPLFTGYLFARVDPRSPERIEVLKAPGTVRIVGFGDAPTPVDDEVVESLMILVGRGQDEVRPHPLVRAGQRVRVTDGPFAGASGVLSVVEGRRPRLVVEVSFLGRAVAVPVSAEQVQPLLL
ncbi:MAG: transcription termination/antitermination NusG family protein [Polyangia bacterium]